MKKRKIAKAALAVLSVLTIGAAGASLAACDKDDEHSHAYGGWTLVTEPTLTAGGKAERYCKDNDGGKEEVTVPMLTDTTVWTENLEAKVDPTHTTAGSRQFTSTDYGTVTVTLPLDANAHSYGKWTITKDPTNTEQGKAERVCGGDSSHVDKIDLAPLSDTTVWTLDTTKGEPATHTKAGKMVFTSVYGEVTVIVPADVTAHTYGDWTFVTDNVPTLTAGGKIQRVCDGDNTHKETEDVPALTDTTFWTKADKTPATHQTGGVADFTNATYKIKVEDVAIPKVEHTFGKWTVTTDPTATAKGEATRVCSEEGCAEDATATQTQELPVLTDATFWTHTHADANYNAPETDTYTNETYGTVTVIGAPKLAAPYDNGEYYGFTYYVNGDDKIAFIARDHLYGGSIIRLDGATGAGDMQPLMGTVTFNSENPNELNGKLEIVVNDSSGKVDTYPAYYDEDSGVVVMIYSNTQFYIFTPYSFTKEVDKYDEETDTTSKVTGNFANAEADAAYISVGNDTLFAVDYAYSETKNLTIFINEGEVTFNTSFKDVNGSAVRLDKFNEVTSLIVADKDGVKVGHYGLNPATEKWQVTDGFEGKYTADSSSSLDNILLNGAGLLECTLGGDKKVAEYKYVGVDGFDRETVGAVIDGKYYEIWLKDGTACAYVSNAVLVFHMNEQEIVPPAEGVFDRIDSDGNYRLSVSKTIPFKLPVVDSTAKQFMGWYLDMECTQPVELDKDGNYVPMNSLTLYAKWSVKVVITIEGAMDGDNGVIHVGAGEILSGYLPHYTAGVTIDRFNNRKFVGWFYNGEQISEDIALGDNLTEITLTAHWTPCLAYEGTYSGVYIFESNDNLFYNTEQSISIDVNGKITAPNNSDLNGKTVYMTGNTFWAKDSADSEKNNFYGIYDIASGMIAYSNNKDTTDFAIGSKTFIMIVDKTQVTLPQGNVCHFGNKKARLMTLIVDGEEFNVFTYDGAFYGDVTFTSTDGAVTAGNAYAKNQLSVFDKYGNLVAYFVKDGDKGLVLADGYQGTFTNGSTTAVVDGIGGITVNGVEGVYEIIDTNVLGVYLNDRTEYIEVTLDIENLSYTSEKPEVTITFVYGDGTGTKETDTVNKNIVYSAFPTVTPNNSTIHIFVGWYLDADLTEAVPADWAPEGNVSLYAKYGEKKSLTIHGLVYGEEGTTKYFYSDGNFYDENGTLAEIVVNEPADKLHYFAGWFTDPDFAEGSEYDITAAVTEDKVIYAKWAESPVYYKEYIFRYDYATTSGTGYWRGDSSGRVTFGVDGVSTSSQAYPFGNNASAPVTISGYSTDSNELVIDYYENGNTSSHKYSKGIIDQDTGIIIFSYNTGSGASGAANPPLDLSKLFVLIPNSSNSSINGSLWNSGKSRAITVIIDGVGHNIFVNSNEVYFDVTFKGAENENINAESCYSAEKLYVFDKDNKQIYYAEKIDGVLTGLDGRQGEYTVTKVGDEELSFITLSLNGAGTVTVGSDTGTYTVDGDVIKLKFNEAYYEITAIDVDAKTCSVKKPMSTVKFNTAYGIAADITVNTNMTVTLPVLENTVTHTFDGWFENADFSGNKLTDSFVPATEGEVILHAKWLEKAVVTFNYGVDGLDNVVYSDGYEGVAIGDGNLAAPAYNDGKIVVGWFTKDGTNDDWGEEVTSDTLITSTAMTVYAKWEQGVYLITTTGTLADYKWTKDENGVWTSGGKKVSNLNNSADKVGLLEIHVYEDALITLTGTEEGEKGWDYLLITHTSGSTTTTIREKGSNGATKVDFKHQIDVNAGDIITLKWTKDNSGDKGADCATLTSVECLVKYYNPVTLTYNYNGQGTENSVVSMTSFDKVDTLQEVTFTNGEALFSGWFTKDGTNGDWGEEFVAGTLILKDTVLYAKWEVPKYEIISTGSYVWTEKDGAWTSGNKDKKDTDSTMQIKILKDTNISLHWDVNCYEDDYGISWSSYLTITLKSDSTSKLVNQKTGTASGNITNQAVKAGDIIEITYHRTSESYWGSYRDTAIISNIVVS